MPKENPMYKCMINARWTMPFVVYVGRDRRTHIMVCDDFGRLVAIDGALMRTSIG